MKRQADGLIVVVLITAAALLLKLIFLNPPPQAGVQLSHGDFLHGPIAVKLMGAVERNGIYFLPEKTNLGGFLKIAGIRKPESVDVGLPETMLQAGQAVAVHAGKRIEIGEMDAAERLALDMPIDLNQATLEDLTLVPGIGERTAEKILSFRTDSGSFRTVEDLQKISGIKGEKLSRLRKYFYVKNPSGKSDQSP
jgi:competence protein ComEA